MDIDFSLNCENLNKGQNIFSNMSTKVSTNLSDTEHYLPDEKLLNILDTLRQNISDGKYSEDIQTEILESVEGYVTGKGIELDPEIVKFLVSGWWVQSAMEKIKSEVKPEDPQVCPLCLQEKIELDISNNTYRDV